MDAQEMNFHDKIAKLCFEHFQSLPKSGKPKENEWTTLSCIVQENTDKLEVIALGTGSKCIGNDKMSKSGDILNDSHAEVMCRRAFLRYLYENMIEESIILKYDEKEKHFLLDEKLKFHFFTTHVPCGDAAIFAKQNAEYFGNLVTSTSNKQEEEIFEGVGKKRLKLGEKNSDDIFRTGAKCLETDINQDLRLDGAAYHVTGVVRTKPGRGTATLSVSCSDKLAKWCHLGIQGALLSILIKTPVYLSSFTISGGCPYNEEAMQRALYERLGDVRLEFPYKRVKMIFGQANLKFTYCKSDEKKPCPSSIAWLKTKHTEKQMEVAVEGRRQGITKKQLKTKGKLKICKAELFSYFLQTIKQFQIKLEDSNSFTYKTAKLNSIKFQKAWTTLKKCFKVWTEKDDGLLQFSAQSKDVS